MPTNDFSSLPAFAFEAEAAIQGALRRSQAFEPVCESAQTESVITGVSGPFADALRSEGAAAERERIRLELIVEVRRLGGKITDGYADEGDDAASEALRDFARRLEAKP